MERQDKRCQVCKVIWPLTEFSVIRGGPKHGKPQKICKSCKAHIKRQRQEKELLDQAMMTGLTVEEREAYKNRREAETAIRSISTGAASILNHIPYAHLDEEETRKLNRSLRDMKTALLFYMSRTPDIKLRDRVKKVIQRVDVILDASLRPQLS